MSGISSSDIANATANEAQRSVEDHAVLIQWLIARVEYLESFILTPDRIDRPELPSERRRRLFLEEPAKWRADGRPNASYLQGK